MDLDGDGVETVSLEDGIYFDHDGNRFAEKTGWVGADDAFLAWDRNGNGQIDDGSELFGNNFTLANGRKAANGFEALAEFDSNGDGVVDRRDDRWSELKLWQDRDADGFVDEGEMLTMEKAGIVGLNLGYKNQSKIDPNGNDHRQSGTFIRDDGTTGTMDDVWFAANVTDSHYLPEVEISEEIKGLPNLKGYGNTPGLHQAMALDSSGRLQSLMERFVGSDPAQAKSLVWDIIFAWTGVTDADPGSRGTYIGDARKLLAIEKLVGQAFNSIYWGSNPGPAESNSFREIFAKWEKEFTSYLMLSTHYRDLFGLAVQASGELDSGAGPEALTALMATLETLYASGADSGRLFIADFLSQLGAYDSRGVKCIVAIQGLYDPLSTSEFERFIASCSGNIILGTVNGDTLTGSVGNDYLYGGAGNDTLNGNVGNDFLEGDEGNDTLNGSTGHDTLLGGLGNDALSGGDGDDVLDSGDGDDYLDGSNGNDTLLGGTGNDSLSGGYGDDVLNGGSGNDSLSGGYGNDTFVFGKGYGHDTVDAWDSYDSTKHDKVKLVGLASDEVEFGMVNRNGNYDLVIRIKATGETMTILNGMYNNSYAHQIQSVEFGDGTVWSYADILTNGLYATNESETLYLYQSGVLHGLGGDDVLYGSSHVVQFYGDEGNDSLVGGYGDDVLDGGTGNDYLYGGSGDDTFVFGKGYGYDTVVTSDVSNNRNDRVKLVGLSPSEVEFCLVTQSSREDLVIRIKATGETMTIQNGMNNSYYTQIQSVEFGDGTVWSYADIRTNGLYGTTEAETFTLTQGGVLHGQGGDDVLRGSSQPVQFYGDEGNDSLVGGYGDDVLDGGAGNDTLTGGAGNDSYIFGHGDGQDTINNYGGGSDVLKFADIDPAELWFGKSGNHLVIGLIGGSDQVTVSNWYSSSSYQIATIQTDSEALMAAQVNQLVQAMAAIGAPGGAGGQWTDEQRDALAPVLTSYWQPRV